MRDLTFLLRTLPFAALVSCLGSIGETSESSGGPGGDDPPAPPTEFEANAPVFPRLTVAQYRASLAELLGGDLPSLALEPDTNPYLFDSVGATTTTVSELGVQQYEESADAVTHYLFSDPGRRVALVGCTPVAPGDACAQTFLTDLGRRAYRRPLAAEELGRWVGVATSSSPDPWEGLRLATAGILQSPHFLYRVELGEPDPENPGLRRLGAYEVASRLAFLLWNQTPDVTLLDAARDGELDTPEGIRTQAIRLLSDPRASQAIQRFFAQYLNLDKLDGITRDAALYPLFTPTMPAAMRREVELVVDRIVMKDRADVRSLFDTRTTFVNSELAALYGLEAPGAAVDSFVEVELPADGPRAGILTLGAFLTINAHQVQTSPTLRGKYIRQRLLCELVQPPPPDVDTELPPPSGEEPQTLREQLSEHVSNPTCAGCHSIMDPPGFLFENFDNVGEYRTVFDNGIPVDATGDLDGEPLQNALELAPVIATHPRLGKCLVRQLYRHTMGRLDTEGEQPAIDELDSILEERAFDFQALLVDFVTHESFLTVAEPDLEDP
jgi:hypothetical protein